MTTVTVDTSEIDPATVLDDAKRDIEDAVDLEEKLQDAQAKAAWKVSVLMDYFEDNNRIRSLLLSARNNIFESDYEGAEAILRGILTVAIGQQQQEENQDDD